MNAIQIDAREQAAAALHNIRGWFFGECAKCKRHRMVATVCHDKEKEARPRCAFCIWRMIGGFKWRAWRPEDSKLYVAPPSLLDARGNPIAAHAA